MKDMKPHHWVAAVGIGFMLIVPIVCLVAWLFGRDGRSAVSFAMIFAGLGWLIIWMASMFAKVEELETDEASE